MITECERCGEAVDKAGKCHGCGAVYASDEDHKAEMRRRWKSDPRFELGQTVATPGALDAIKATGEEVRLFIFRHEHGDWGSVSQGDAWSNDEDLVNGQRLLSQYRLSDDTRIWIITEWDRSVTTVLLPSEY